LGRAHSVRPYGMAKLVPSHFIPTGCGDERPIPTGCGDERPVGLRGHAQMKRRQSFRACGARPSPRRPSGVKGTCLASRGIAGKVVFSEGRTLCARLAWPNVCRGITFSRDGRSGPGRLRAHARMKPRQSLGACGARPSGGQAEHGWPSGENPGITRKAVFSEGRALRVRVARPCASRGIPFPPDGLTISRWPRGHMPRLSPRLPCGRAEPAPPGGGQRVTDGLAGNIHRRRERRFSRRDALCASALEGRTQAPVWHDGREVDEGPVAYRGNARVEPMVSLRACGARPSEGWASQGRMALRGISTDGARGAFLGGTRSARPRGEAGLKPRHIMITGGK